MSKISLKNSSLLATLLLFTAPFTGSAQDNPEDTVSKKTEVIVTENTKENELVVDKREIELFEPKERGKSFDLSSITIENASKRDVTLAAAHWSRSRSLIINALHEFDQGLSKVDPSPLLDPVEWRGALLEKIRELEIVLNPQPRDSITGIKLPANRNLLGDIEEIEKKVKGIE